MKLNLIDYKGKHFILQDQDIELDDDWDLCIGTKEYNDIDDSFLRSHVDACIYYGIPPYIGADKKLNKRIDSMMPW